MIILSFRSSWVCSQMIDFFMWLRAFFANVVKVFLRKFDWKLFLPSIQAGFNVALSNKSIRQLNSKEC